MSVKTDLSRFFIHGYVEGPTPDSEQSWTQSCYIKTGNRISETAFKVNKYGGRAIEIKQNRVAPFFNFFSSILTFSTYLMVSHQSYISLYDLREKDQKRRLRANLNVGTQIVAICKVEMCVEIKWFQS